MKKVLVIFAVFVATQTLSARTMAEGEDSTPRERVLSGWSVVPLPTASYTTENGFQIGALANFCYYGPNRCNFPVYDHEFFLDLGYSFKGNRFGYIGYDSSKLIPGIRFTASAMYQSHKSYPFMGFNGMASPYYVNQYYMINGEGKEEVSGFYQMRKDMLRIFLDFKGEIVPGLQWAAGLNLWNLVVKDTDRTMKTSQGTNLLGKYITNGIITADEANGGFHAEFKAGLIYDTRDNEASTKKGIWAEAFFYGSPDIFQRRNHYLNLAVHFRHYIPIVSEKLTFAYHLAYQGTLLGDMPFYMLSNIAALSLRQVDTDGLGSYTSLRGLLYNRLLGKGYGWSNIELRWYLFDFDWLGINWGIATNPFFDLGMVVQPYRLDRMIASGDTMIYSGIKGDQLHCSAGLGFKLAIDYNFILSAEYAYPFLRREQDGPGSISIGVDYIF